MQKCFHLTAVVAYDEIDIRPKVERAEEMVTHEILQRDAFNQADISLRTHTEDNIQPITSCKKVPLCWGRGVRGQLTVAE